MVKKFYSSVEMIQQLVAFDTTSSKTNMHLIDFIQRYLSLHGVESTLIPDPTANKSNLYATIGPEETPGVVLSGHTDVVPVDGQSWETKPFDVTEKNGRLYGRGTSDMKSFIAITLSLVPYFLAQSLKIPIHLAFSYDEEIGCLGAPRMIAQFGKAQVMPLACFVGEPTNMKVVNAHKGVHGFRTTVYGLEQHSSATHKGVNAVQYASRLITYLSDLSNEISNTMSDSQSEFEPPYTTIHVGTIQGGTAQNIIPKECTFSWEYRLMPEENPEEIYNKFKMFVDTDILPSMRKNFANASVDTIQRTIVPGLRAEKNSFAEELALNIAKDNSTGVVSFGTEAGQFQSAGVPTIICGPGSIEQAHKPNEFIELKQVSECEGFLRKLSEFCCYDKMYDDN
tara:strand:- start:1966 stop:3153 length:1188 start_codon:yes stop_codon:yes gene_type:complete